MSRVCRIAVWGFGVLYVVAILLLLVGTFGWFGSPQGPLAGVFLAPLGLPWNLLLSGAPEALLPWVGVAAPAINLLILSSLCRWLNR
jgi:hypothetical protein